MEDAPGDEEYFSSGIDLDSIEARPGDDDVLDLGDDTFSTEAGVPHVASLETEGPEGPMMGQNPMIDQALSVIAPRPRYSSPMLGHEMPSSLPRLPGHRSTTYEYWSVTGPNGTHGAEVVQDGSGHTSVKEIHHKHHDSTGHHHSGKHPHQGAGAMNHNGKHGNEEVSRPDDRSNERSNDRTEAERQNGKDAHPRDADSQTQNAHTRTEEEPDSHPVILISVQHKDDGFHPTAVVGGLIAIFAQAYLWGNVFTTLFKPQRRAVDSSVGTPETAIQSAQGNVQRGTDTTANIAAPADLDPRRFSGASGVLGADPAGAGNVSMATSS
jgi:hypothetical protein